MFVRMKYLTTINIEQVYIQLLLVTFSRPTARSAEGLLLLDCVCVCVSVCVLSHISSPVIGRHSSLNKGYHWLTQYSLCTIQVYRVVRSSDHGDLSRKNPLTMHVCPKKKLVTLRRNLMRLTKRLMKLEDQN
jgi:hypothetical protein